MVEAVNTFCGMAQAHDRDQPGTSSFQSQILFLAPPFPFGQMRSSTSCFVKSLEGSMEAEAVDGKLKEAEAEAKEKLTAVPSLLAMISLCLIHIIVWSPMQSD